MISLTRPAKPRILAQKEAEWLLAFQNAANKAEEKRHRKKYNHNEVRSALVQMHSGKCAYCESKIEHVSVPQIEHFRPVTKFSHLTFDWDNLFLACSICNGSSYKSDQFPTTMNDEPLLLNPCEDDIDAHLTFDYDPIAQLANVNGKTPKGNTTVEVLGLNRKELRQHRSQQIRKLMALKQMATTNSEAQSLLAEAKQASGEYAAFSRQV